MRMTSATDEPRSSHGLPRVLGISALVLACGATAALVLTEETRWLRLGIVAALWAALGGAFIATRYRRQAVDTEEIAAEAQEVYELELEREISARREYELEIEAETRAKVEAETTGELQALRAEVQALRESLESLVGGEVLFERVALTAQSARMRSINGENQVVGQSTYEQYEQPALSAAAHDPESDRDDREKQRDAEQRAPRQETTIRRRESVVTEYEVTMPHPVVRPERDEPSRTHYVDAQRSDDRAAETQQPRTELPQRQPERAERQPAQPQRQAAQPEQPTRQPQQPQPQQPQPQQPQPQQPQRQPERAQQQEPQRSPAQRQQPQRRPAPQTEAEQTQIQPELPQRKPESQRGPAQRQPAQREEAQPEPQRQAEPQRQTEPQRQPDKPPRRAGLAAGRARPMQRVTQQQATPQPSTRQPAPEHTPPPSTRRAAAEYTVPEHPAVEQPERSVPDRTARPMRRHGEEPAAKTQQPTQQPPRHDPKPAEREQQPAARTPDARTAHGGSPTELAEEFPLDWTPSWETGKQRSSQNLSAAFPATARERRAEIDEYPAWSDAFGSGEQPSRRSAAPDSGLTDPAPTEPERHAAARHQPSDAEPAHGSGGRRRKEEQPSSDIAALAAEMHRAGRSGGRRRRAEPDEPAESFSAGDYTGDTSSDYSLSNGYGSRQAPETQTSEPAPAASQDPGESYDFSEYSSGIGSDDFASSNYGIDYDSTDYSAPGQASEYSGGNHYARYEWSNGGERADTGGGRRRRPEGEPPWEGLRGWAPGAEDDGNNGSHAKPAEPEQAPEPEPPHGSHAAGRSVSDLLAAYGGQDAPRRRRRKED